MLGGDGKASPVLGREGGEREGDDDERANRRPGAGAVAVGIGDFRLSSLRRSSGGCSGRGDFSKFSATRYNRGARDGDVIGGFDPLQCVRWTSRRVCNNTNSVRTDR